MRPDKHIWIALSAFFCSLGTYVLVNSESGSGPYAEGYILLGATLAALGLSALFFAFKQRAQIKALALHMERGSQSFEGQRRKGHGYLVNRVNTGEQADESQTCEERVQEALNEK